MTVVVRPHVHAFLYLRLALEREDLSNARLIQSVYTTA